MNVHTYFQEVYFVFKLNAYKMNHKINKISQLTEKLRNFFIIFILTIMTMTCNSQQKSDDDPFKRDRKLMVKNQIKARGIDDEEVINAMLKVKRHKFVPDEYIREAYDDHPLPIGHGQTISQPYIVAIMTEFLDLDKSEKVLEIGTGSGYQAAILAEICDSVYTIEIVEPLGQSAKKKFEELGYKNIEVKIGDGYQGWEEKAPFDAIIVTCAPTHIPEPLKNQLREGGKMLIPVGERYTQKLVMLSKIKGEIKEETIIHVRFVPMVKENGNTY